MKNSLKRLISITLGLLFLANSYSLVSADLFCNGSDGLNTAIGCIPIGDTQSLLIFILRWAIGVGGGISLLLIIIASFMTITSSGNPERVQAGKELLTSAIAGLIMLIFSFFILKVIGVDLLKLPGSPSL